MQKSIANINKRQEEILRYIEESKQVSVSAVYAALQKKMSTIAKVTISRDLKKLVDFGFLVQKGAGRSVVYELSTAYKVIRPIDIEKYFEIEVDERQIQEYFQFDIFAHLHDILTEDEKEDLQQLQETYQKKITQLPKDALQKEFERLTIELSWKSSKIEGNTYSLLETEQLIREHTESIGHTKEEAVMILNHKKALDYIRQHTKQFRNISLRNIEEIHSILIEGLGISRNVRNSIVRITGTRYTPIDNQFQITEAIEKTCDIVNTEKNPFAKAIIIMILIAYIQPFVDGNKRTSRLIGNALLLAYDCCPLSYRSVDEMEYKKAILLFYEQHNISYFKKLFLEQMHFAVKNYFG